MKLAWTVCLHGFIECADCRYFQWWYVGKQLLDPLNIFLRCWSFDKRLRRRGTFCCLRRMVAPRHCNCRDHWYGSRLCISDTGICASTTRLSNTTHAMWFYKIYGRKSKTIWHPNQYQFHAGIHFTTLNTWEMTVAESSRPCRACCSVCTSVGSWFLISIGEIVCLRILYFQISESIYSDKVYGLGWCCRFLFLHVDQWLLWTLTSKWIVLSIGRWYLI